jgi:hypothetical protein
LSFTARVTEAGMLLTRWDMGFSMVSSYAVFEVQGI